MGFEDNYGEAGKRGVGILVERNEFGPRFTLQYRAVDKGHEEDVHGPSNLPVSTVCEVGMQFCPWCGANLEQQYGKHAAEMYRPELSISIL